ncbi:YxeA family protein [Bacillus haynesii]|uniref:YxeA family protein n=1 Tax=Bacillus haynesii TaxID=1925021 RepID=UPI00228316FC|nr:YxeA family protein [Bacillus haynesii]MCY8222556.1 YxeA family protein [Bacillus haynesii]MEC1471054.1 YxeA family protein [Bacillus haynesii]MEC1483690.1 YxeA family protein [Bacillus haynesii]
MKKTIFLITAVLAVCIGAFLLIHNEVTDRFNPLVKKESVYVQINKDGKHLSPGRYEYTLEGYNDTGKEKEITFSASGSLRKNAYLKVDAKGKYVETWEEVQPGDMPSAVRTKLIKQ